MNLARNVATLLVCVLGYGATIDDADICLAAASGALKTSCFELASKCRSVWIYTFLFPSISLLLLREVMK